jgi:hypothetical protein
MSMKRLLFGVLWLLPAIVFAQSPFDGTWKTNMAESKLSQKPYVYSVNNGMYDCDTCAPKVHVKTDGQDQPVTGQTYDTLAVEVVDASTVHMTTKKAGKTMGDQIRKASADGKTMTISVTSHPADGSELVKMEVHLARISAGASGSNATSGTWRLQDLNEDSAGITSTWKGSGDGISVSSPTGVSWEAKLDGKEYPVKGVYGNETVSVKKLGDHAIEVTYKLDGEINSVDKVTVSSDGTKMTTVSDNKRTGRVSTYVDEKQ